MPLGVYSLDARIELARRAAIRWTSSITSSRTTGRAGCCCAICATPHCEACASACWSTISIPREAIRCSSAWQRFRTSRCACSIRSAAAARACSASTPPRSPISGGSTTGCTTSSSSPTARSRRRRPQHRRRIFHAQRLGQLRRHGCVRRGRRRAAARPHLRHLLEQPAGLSGGGDHRHGPRSRAAAAELQRARRRRRADDGVTLPPIDILGYGPISDDLDAGRLGLVWGKANAYADSPAKVTATSDEMARSMSVSMNVMDLVMASRTEVVISSPYFIPGTEGRAGIRRTEEAQCQGHDPHQFACVERRAARSYRLCALPGRVAEDRRGSL